MARATEKLPAGGGELPASESASANVEYIWNVIIGIDVCNFIYFIMLLKVLHVFLLGRQRVTAKYGLEFAEREPKN